MRLAIHGFVGLCRYYLPPATPMFPQYFNQDLLEHHCRNIRGTSGDMTTPPVADCARAARQGTVIRLHCDTKGNSGGAPLLDIGQVPERRQRPAAEGKENT